MKAETLLRRILAAARAQDSGYVLALERDGMEDVPESLMTVGATWTVKRAQSELDLRHMLWKANGAPLLALVPKKVAQELAPDLVRRARAGRVVAPTPLEILSAALDVSIQGFEDPKVLDLALEHLEGLQAALGDGRTNPTVLDRRVLEEMLLDVCVGERLRQITQPGRLLALWLREPPKWPDAVRGLVERHLPRRLGAEGRILAWALGGGEPMFEEIVVRGVLFAIDPSDVPESLWDGPLDALRGAKSVDLEKRELTRALAALATEAVDELGADAASLLDRAGTLATRLLAPSVVGKSQHLKVGLENRARALVKRLERGETVAAADVDWLRNHRAAKLFEREIDVLEEMARVARWLNEEAAPAETVLDFVRAYQASGAFADLAAAQLRRALGQVGQFHAEANALLDRWEERRNAQNHRFAERLARGYVDQWHADGVVPLHRLWTEAALKGDACRREDGDGGLFLVVLDGCSYPVFIDLVHRLAGRVPPLGIVTPEGQSTPTIPALAPLPTITSHARGAIFLGELPQDPWALETVWKEDGERKTDPARFKNNVALGDRTRQLFLKRDLDDGGAALRQSLASELDVVAVVFNAVDDLIGGKATGVVRQLAPEDIAGFVPALEAAVAAGRRVLLTADHGHTPYLSKARGVGKGSTSRWMLLEGDEAVPDGWLEIDVKGLGGPAGRKAFAWKVGSYRGKPQVGFHGGCGLEEMVVPLAWIGDHGVGADLPLWWYGQNPAGEDLDYEGVETTPPPKAPPKKKSGRPKKPAAGQLHLYDNRETAKAVSRTVDTSKLGLSKEVLAELDAGEIATLGVVAENGTVTADDLAAVQQRNVARVPGYMTKLNRKLHGLGAACFEREPLPDGKVAYRWTGASQ